MVYYKEDCHSVHYQQVLAKKSTTGANKRTASEVDEAGHSKKQMILDDHILQIRTASKQPTQKDFDFDVLTLIVEDSEPLPLVERSGFRSFCEKYISRYKIPSRRALSRRVIEVYDDNKAKLLKKL